MIAKSCVPSSRNCFGNGTHFTLGKKSSVRKEATWGSHVNMCKEETRWRFSGADDCHTFFGSMGIFSFLAYEAGLLSRTIPLSQPTSRLAVNAMYMALLMARA